MNRDGSDEDGSAAEANPENISASAVDAELKSKAVVSESSGPSEVTTAGEASGVSAAKTTPVPAAPKSGEMQAEPVKAFSMEEANEEIAKLLETGKVTQQEVQSLQGMMREHASLKVKVDRLKGLLGRSAKAQREAKAELEQTQKKLDQALRDVKRLNQKVEHLSTRPTHSKSQIVKLCWKVTA